jgi:peptidoglycan/xylan/chitin deacetylase (PgdA/CDA1 family)
MKALVPFGFRRRVLTSMIRAPIPTSDPRRRVVVFLYHSIHPVKGFASATPALFEEHMEWLTQHCDIISFEEALTVARGPQHTKPSVAITFDDGYADTHEHALPLLARHGIPATFFLMAGLLDRDPSVVSRMATLQGVPPDEVAGLSWGHVLEMRDAGMTFGSHGVNHLNLAQAKDLTVTYEARTSKDRLEEKLGKEVTCFAYPFGKPKHHFTARTMRLVKSCGYEMAGTTTFRRVKPTDDPMAIPRFAVTMDSIAMLEAKVKGKLDVIGMYQQYAPAWAGRIISPETSVTK